MKATLADRKRQAVLAKSRSLCGELCRWRILSDTAAPFEKHNSQVIRIAARLEGLLVKINAELDAPDFDILGRGRVIEEKLLTAHVIWEFFRAKLGQRLDQGFTDYLRVCDEFAWKCYEPVREKFLAQPANVLDVMTVKEPPLVFLNGGWSPFALGRDQAFQVERVGGGWLAQLDFRGLVESLPVPLIGLPWYQVAHLPDALVVAHEVGHIVESDFHLTKALVETIDAAGLAGRTSAWQAWLPEVFADVFGCLASGLAFAAALMDFLAQDKARLAADRRNEDAWGAYPPAWLRTALLLEVLSRLAELEITTADLSELKQRHVELFGEPKFNCDFKGDARTVASALLDCPCPTLLMPGGTGMRAPSVRELLPPLGGDASLVARNILSEGSVDGDNTRLMMAAALCAWEIDPAGYIEMNLDERFRLLIQTRPGVRGTPADQIEDKETDERDAGEHWLDDFFGEPSNSV